MSVVIRQWPSIATYYTVALNTGPGSTVGYIDVGVADKFYFHGFKPYNHLDAYSRAMVDHAVGAKIKELDALYMITRRLTCSS